MRNSTKLNLKSFVCGLNRFPINSLQWSLKGPGEVCHRACPTAYAKQNLVRVIVNVVVRERLEKLY